MVQLKLQLHVANSHTEIPLIQWVMNEWYQALLPLIHLELTYTYHLGPHFGLFCDFHFLWWPKEDLQPERTFCSIYQSLAMKVSREFLCLFIIFGNSFMKYQHLWVRFPAKSSIPIRIIIFLSYSNLRHFAMAWAPKGEENRKRLRQFEEDWNQDGQGCQVKSWKI